MATTLSVAEVKSHVERKVSQLQGRANAWTDRFKAHPAEALEWAQEIFDVATQLEAFQILLRQLDRGTALCDIMKGWARQLRTKSRNPERSTSQTSNLIERARLAATSEVLEVLEE